jgi:hypothetical protein
MPDSGMEFVAWPPGFPRRDLNNSTCFQERMFRLRPRPRLRRSILGAPLDLARPSAAELTAVLPRHDGSRHDLLFQILTLL